MKLTKNWCHNEASKFKASCGYLVRLPRHVVLRNDSSRGAMFGLDARIALAIFGALSVISGAALYSAIKTAKTERYWQEFRGIIKATEQYYLDNAQLLPSSVDTVYIADLLENREGLRTWDGPYLTAQKHGADTIKSSMTKEFSDDAGLVIHLFKDSSWAGDYDVCDVDSVDCVEWIRLYTTDSNANAELKKLFDLLDEKIDNNDGIKAGNIRMYDYSGMYINLYIKGISHKKV